MPEAILLHERNGIAMAVLYAKEPSGWRRQGSLSGAPPLSLAEWTAAIRAGQAKPAPPAWPDVRVGERRYRIQ